MRGKVGNPAFTVEIQATGDGVRDGKEPDLLSGQLARDAPALCHKEGLGTHGKVVAVQAARRYTPGQGVAVGLRPSIRLPGGGV